MPLKTQTPEATGSVFASGRIKAYAAFVAATLVYSATAVAEAASPLLMINGTTTRTAEAEHNRVVFVPAQSVFSGLGEVVTYQAPLAIVTAKNGTELARLTTGSNHATLKGRPHVLAAAPFAEHGALMVPLRFVSEAAGASVTYSASPRSISIHKSLQAAAAGGRVTTAPAADVARADPIKQTADAASPPPAGAARAESGIPWWAWLLAVLVVLGIVLLFMRRKKEPLITTRRTGRSNNPYISTRK